MITPDNYNALFNLVSGPLMWVAAIVFLVGSIYRMGSIIFLVNRKEPFIYSYLNGAAIVRSMMHWLLPFGTTSWRNHPVVTVMTFVFHCCLLAVPIFLTAHVVMVNFSWGVSWPTLPDVVADGLTVIIIACCGFFLIRRLTQPEVRYVTTPSDYGLLLIVAAPFVTGFMAYHQWAGYNIWLLLHIISGEIMLMAIPFTRLSHMFLAVFTRSYLASEFGHVRNARDW